MIDAGFFDQLRQRGLVQQCTDDAGMGAWLAEQQRTLYAGFDPTADSLHVGSLVPLMALRRFQRAGHRPIAVVGGATGMIGDPSGKSAERKLLSPEQLRHNVEGIRGQMERLLEFGSAANSALLVDNYDWMGPVSFIEFLRDVGKHVPVNTMLAKESVKNRLERTDAGLSFTEFSYMLLQAYDFVHLRREFGCELQVGGSDQWGNITAGIDLARRMDGVQLYGVTLPLLTKSDGSKMGKTESGTIWLDERRTSPYAFYQYWIRVEDADVSKCLRYLTELPLEEIEALDEATRERAHEKAAQRRLAESLTELIHGSDGLERARRATEVLFGGSLEGFSASELTEIFADVPSQELTVEQLRAGLGIVDAFALSGLCGSKSEARRLLAQGGLYVNQERCGDVEAQLTEGDLLAESFFVLRSGRKKYALLRVADRS
ncbi:MAG: tyrosine--tRNA ligase [Planctomycetales bacterium]|nr:tyrosine--tRNA ligase [Planctomycetales bacterium]